MATKNPFTEELYISFNSYKGVGSLFNNIETFSMRLLKYLDKNIIGPLPFLDGANFGLFFSIPTEYRAKQFSTFELAQIKIYSLTRSTSI